MSKDSRFEGVLWNCPQNLSEEEKAQARANIGAGTGGGGGDPGIPNWGHFNNYYEDESKYAEITDIDLYTLPLPSKVSGTLNTTVVRGTYDIHARMRIVVNTAGSSVFPLVFAITGPVEQGQQPAVYAYEYSNLDTTLTSVPQFVELNAVIQLNSDTQLNYVIEVEGNIIASAMVEDVYIHEVKTITSGGGGSSDVVVMHLENALGNFMQGDPIPAQNNPQIWEDMVDVILNGKILMVTMGIEEGIGSNAICRTYFDVPTGHSIESFKQILRSNEQLGTLDFMFDVSMYGGLINIGAKIKVSPTKGIIPYYFYMSTGSGGLALELGTIDYQTQTRAIVGEVLGFAYNENDDTYSISYSYLPHILADLQNQGKTITITGANKNGSYMFASAPVKITITEAEPRSDFIAEVNTLGQYIAPNFHEGEQHPVLWRGGFKYIEAPSGGQIDGYYKLDSDQTFVMDFMLLDNPSDEESNGSLDE